MIVKYLDEAKEAKKLWKELTYNEVLFELYNKDVVNIQYLNKKIDGGSIKGGWESVPKGEVCEVISGRDGILGTENQQCAMFAMPGLFFGIAWQDNTAEVSKYACWISGSQKTLWATMRYQVQQSNIKGQITEKITDGEVQTMAANGTRITIDPAFEPFKITVSSYTTAETLKEGEVRLVHSGHGTAEGTAKKYEHVANVLMKRSKNLRKSTQPEKVSSK